MKQHKIHLKSQGGHLTQEELISYSRADLGIDEMYRLELHIIDCELCSTALEGIENSKFADTFDSDVGKIKASVKSSEELRLGPFHLGAAAAFLIIAAVGIIFLTRKPDETMLAETKVENIRESQPSYQQAPVVTDSIGQVENSGKEEAPVELEEEPQQVAGSETKPEIEPPAVTGVTAQPESARRVTEDTIDEIATEQLADVNNAEPEEELIETRELSAAPSAAKAAEPSDLNQVQPVVDLPQAEIIGGNASLRRHIRKNIQYPEEAEANNIKGTVTLMVTVSPKGAITDIKVLEGLGYGCDEEAIRLIQTGPGWQAGEVNGVPVVSQREVEVRFR